MQVSDVVASNLTDLKMGIDLANIINNGILLDYSLNRIKMLEENKDFYKFVSINTLVDSYVIDIALFINISNIVHDIESKDYFKSRLIDVMKYFPELNDRRDLIKLL